MGLTMVGYTGGPLALTGRLLVTDGTAGAPTVSFTADTDTGFYRIGSNSIGVAIAGVAYVRIDGSINMANDSSFGWTSSAATATIDTVLWRDAANIIAMRNGTTAQIARIYNTFTNATNYERLDIGWAANVVTIGPAAAGTGTLRGMTLSGSVTFSGALLASDGLVGTPSITFASATNYGFYFAGNHIIMALASAVRFDFSAGNLDLTNTTASYSFNQDCFINRDAAADTIAQRRGTNAQILRIYNTYTDASNYERFDISWAANVVTIGPAAAGSGTLRAMTLTGAITTTAGVTVTTMLTAAQVNVTGNGAPSNGIYLQAANTLGLAASGGASVLISTSSVALQTGIALNMVTAAMAVGATYSSGNGIFVQNASTNNAISTGSQGGATTALFIGNAQITAVSDIRLKTAITPTKIDAMALIHQLDVIDFTWNDPSDQAPVNKNSRGRWTGITAQNLINVAPWVVNAPDRTCPYCRAGRICTLHPEMWQVDLDYLSGLFTKALQQIDIRLTALEDVVLR